jgi:lysylphosphatidylglycerol synthetase-like protein (DUF2156 family)
MEPYAVIALVTFLVAYGTLATEKINRTVVVGAALVLLITGVLTLAEAINYVNWETIGLLFGMFIIVVVLSDAGFFSYVAFILAKRLKLNPPFPSDVGPRCASQHLASRLGSNVDLNTQPDFERYFARYLLPSSTIATIANPATA